MFVRVDNISVTTSFLCPSMFLVPHPYLTGSMACVDCSSLCLLLPLGFCNGDNRGIMIIRGEEVASCADRCKLTIRGIKLKNKDGMFGKSDPFFTLSRLREDEKWQQVCT